MVKPTYTTVCRSAAPAPLAAAGMCASAVASDAPPARSAARRVAETETDSRDARAFDVRVFDARLWPANTRAAKIRADDDDRATGRDDVDRGERGKTTREGVPRAFEVKLLTFVLNRPSAERRRAESGWASWFSTPS